ncbi:hypothetical protein [Maricaulis sp.]|uniref:hypothetical protein n=1 Tax=Maricaulis sp. TaxID=1486257 RepID=UPI002B270932|nr:hypothetical protein [Maricaulis sp.]
MTSAEDILFALMPLALLIGVVCISVMLILRAGKRSSAVLRMLEKQASVNREIATSLQSIEGLLKDRKN